MISWKPTAAAAATVLLCACVVASVELGETLPGIREAPAPEWARPGVRLAYYSVMASTPASTHYYTPNEDGDWVSGDGKRWDQGRQPGAAGHGFTLVDFLEVTAQGAMLSLQAWQKDLTTDAVCPIAGGRSFQTSAAGGGDWWVHPAVLARVAQIHHTNPDTLDQIKVLRMNQRMIDGSTRQVLRFQFEYRTARHIVAYELSTGLLVYKATAAQGQSGRFSRGNTVITQLWLVGQRQVRTPWAGTAIQQGLARGTDLRYEGTVAVMVPRAGSTMTLPLSADLHVTTTGRTWFTFQQTTVTGTLQGMPPSPPETTHQVSGTAQSDPLWIPPASLRALRPGQVIDRDPTVGETISVRSAGGGTVTIAAVSQAVDVERVYDAATGLLLSFRVAGGPSELAKSLTQARLVRGP